MARTAIPVLHSSRYNFIANAPNTYQRPTDATNGNIITNSGAMILVIENAGFSDETLTVLVPDNVDVTLSVSSRQYNVAAGQKAVVGPFPTATYGVTLLVDSTSTDLEICPITVL